MSKRSFVLILVVFLVYPILGSRGNVHHKVKARIDPSTHSLEAIDTVTIPGNMAGKGVHFLLIKDLQVESLTPGVEIRRINANIVTEDFGMDVEDFSATPGFSLNKYAVIFKENMADNAEFTLKFFGKIHYELQRVGDEYARGFSRTPGIISDQGVYLAGSSFWVPWFNKDLITYELEVRVPETWDVVSHGQRTLHIQGPNNRTVKWESPTPAEEIFVIAAKFHEFSMPVGAVTIMAFLRSPDENLANKYLETTAQYMGMYGKLIGPFPYSKFALVENFWETGYGMPSFTLLGPRIIRFPFILHSSYPHELLHNYWGNSVFVDFEHGNWCEGITVYMADHLIKEQRGQGRAYRRDKLQRYTDYVTRENDFPLSRFKSRHDAATEAVGYGKSMMFMEMLREKTGDPLFIQGFQTFYRKNKFRAASFRDIRMAFESVTGEDLKTFFDQWIKRVGAPEFRISRVSVEKQANGYELNFVLRQIQDGDAFGVDVPLAISFADEIQMKKVAMSKKEQFYSIALEKKPLLLQVDPLFNVFRRLHHAEIPPALSRIYGSENILILLPAAAGAGKMAAYKTLAEKWSANKAKSIVVKFDNEIEQLPEEKDVWVFGQENRYFKEIIQGISGYDAHISADSVRFNETRLPANDQSVVVSVRHPKNPQAILAWLNIANPDSIGLLARKLMHYGKYSYLGFQGKEAVNNAKGQWQAVDSPMVVELEKNASRRAFNQLPKRKPLAVLAPAFSADRMMGHIRFLASEKLRGRGLGTPGLRAASAYIADQFNKIGLKPGGDNGGWFQRFTTVVDGKGTLGEAGNVIGFIAGTDPGYSRESVVVSAHFDHLGLGWPDVKGGNAGEIHNGADDNASGIAVMLELARWLNKTVKPRRAIVFVAFTAEENGMVGSKYYVDNYTKFPAQNVIGNINLDTVGRLHEKKLLVLDSASAREWKFIFMGAGYVTGVESQMVSRQITASDQKSFIEKGVPGVQIFSGAHLDYHTPEDDVEKIDAAGLVKVAAFVREGVLYLAETDKPLHFTGTGRAVDGTAAKEVKLKKDARRASTGIMPDFGFRGAGVCVALVKSGSPADQAGMKKGDVIVRLGNYPARNLREYAAALRKYNPGDAVSLIFLRDEREYSIRLVLGER